MKYKLFIVFFLFINILVFARTDDDNEIMKSGLYHFSNENYMRALDDFKEIITNSSYATLHGKAYYWIARCYLAQNLIDKATNILDFFIQNFHEDKLFPDAIYQKGKLLFRKGSYDDAIKVFYGFVKLYINHPYVPDSYFWIAESLFYLGDFEESKIIYSMIIRKYPNSTKLETSKYKLSLINMKYSQNEFLKQMKISQEEYLKVLKDLQQREKVSEQRIDNYQEKLPESTSNDQKVIISERAMDLSLEDKSVVAMELEIVQLDKTINDLKKQLENLTSTKEPAIDTSVDPDATKSSRLLDIKNSAQELKKFYMNILATTIGE